MTTEYKEPKLFEVKLDEYFVTVDMCSREGGFFTKVDDSVKDTRLPLSLDTTTQAS